jgi:hypothetical protein
LVGLDALEAIQRVHYITNEVSGRVGGKGLVVEPSTVDELVVGDDD